MKKMRCKRCEWLNYDFLDGQYERDLPPFCGLHGRIRVDPDGEQMDLDYHGGCGYQPKNEPKQLSLFDNW